MRNMKEFIVDIIGNNNVLLEDMKDIYEKISKSIKLDNGPFTLKVVGEEITMNVILNFNELNSVMTLEESNKFKEIFDSVEQIEIVYPNKDMMLNRLEMEMFRGNEFHGDRKKLKAFKELNNTYYNPEAFYLKTFKKNLDQVKNALLENNLEKYIVDLNKIEKQVSEEMEVVLIKRLDDALKEHKDIINKVNKINEEIGERNKKMQQNLKEKKNNNQRINKVIEEDPVSIQSEKIISLVDDRMFLLMDKEFNIERIKLIIKDSMSDYLLNNLSKKFYENLWSNINDLGDFSQKNTKYKGLDILLKSWSIYCFENSQQENNIMNDLMGWFINDISRSVKGLDNEKWLNKKLTDVLPVFNDFGVKKESMVCQLLNKKINDQINSNLSNSSNLNRSKKI